MFTIGFLSDYRKLAPFWLAPGMIASAGAAAAQFGFALSPMRAEMNLAPGAQRNGTLTIANDARETSRFRTEILDVSIDKEAVPQFEKDIPSEAGFSCKDWITVNPMEGEMPGSGQMAVRYTFRVPARAPQRTYHCALGFTSLADAKKAQTPIGIVALLRLTCTFYLTVGNPPTAGEVKQIAIEKINAPATSGYRAVISVENSGLTNLRGAGKVDVLNEAGDVIQASDFPPVVILPSRTQRLPVVVKAQMPDGEYTVRARVDLGNNEIQEATYKFRVPVNAE
jgi:hypothetical protein